MTALRPLSVRSCALALVFGFLSLPPATSLAAAAANAGMAAGIVINDEALGDENNQQDWLAYGRTYSEQRFSPLDQVNPKTVANLKVDWFMDLPDAVGLVATPLVADGVMYFISSRNIVYAVDATSGQELWRFDPKVAEVSGKRMRVSYLHGSRGVALWADKVFLATVDGRLIGLNAKTGKQLWSTLTVDPEMSLYISGAPKVFKGKVLIGNGGTENGPVRGYVTAYDADTGKQAWRFWIVPGNPEDGFENDAMKMAHRKLPRDRWADTTGHPCPTTRKRVLPISRPSMSAISITTMKSIYLRGSLRIFSPRRPPKGLGSL